MFVRFVVFFNNVSVLDNDEAVGVVHFPVGFFRKIE